MYTFMIELESQSVFLHLFGLISVMTITSILQQIYKSENIWFV